MLGVADEAPPEGDHQGLPQAGARAAPRHEPGQRRGRGALQGGVGRLRRARRREPSARSTTRCAGSARWAAGRRGGGPAVASASTSTTSRRGAGLGDLLGQMFGRGRRRGWAARRAVGPRRGEDLEAALTLGFADAVRGMTTTLHLTTDAQCSTCGGSGARPGTAPKVCPQCGGRGVIDDNQGLFSFSTPCRAAPAPAASSRTRARRATARGVERRAREVQVRIPAGVTDGQRDPAQGPRRSGPQRRPAGRPPRRHQRDAARALRAQRQRPHRARCRSTSARPPSVTSSACRRSTDPTSTLRIKAGTPVGEPSSRQGQGHHRRRRRRRAPPPATSSSRSTTERGKA